MHRRCVWFLSLATLLAGAPAAAHHSFSAIFDSAKRVTVTGTVSRVESRTLLSPLMTRETVMGETLAWRATS